MSKGLLPDDLVIAVLHYIKTRKRRFTADRERLHELFFDLKSEDPTPLKCLGFRERGLWPESSELDQAFANLEATGLLRRQNDTPRFYFIDPELDKAFRESVRSQMKSAQIEPARIRKLADTFISRAARG